MRCLFRTFSLPNAETSARIQHVSFDPLPKESDLTICNEDTGPFRNFVGNPQAPTGEFTIIVTGTTIPEVVGKAQELNRKMLDLGESYMEMEYFPDSYQFFFTEFETEYVGEYYGDAVFIFKAKFQCTRYQTFEIASDSYYKDLMEPLEIPKSGRFKIPWDRIAKDYYFKVTAPFNIRLNHEDISLKEGHFLEVIETAHFVHHFPDEEGTKLLTKKYSFEELLLNMDVLEEIEKSQIQISKKESGFINLNQEGYYRFEGFEPRDNPLTRIERQTGWGVEYDIDEEKLKIYLVANRDTYLIQDNQWLREDVPGEQWPRWTMVPQSTIPIPKGAKVAILVSSQDALGYVDGFNTYIKPPNDDMWYVITSNLTITPKHFDATSEFNYPLDIEDTNTVIKYDGIPTYAQIQEIPWLKSILAKTSLPKDKSTISTYGVEKVSGHFLYVTPNGYIQKVKFGYPRVTLHYDSNSKRINLDDLIVDNVIYFKFDDDIPESAYDTAWNLSSKLQGDPIDENNLPETLTRDTYGILTFLRKLKAGERW